MREADRRLQWCPHRRTTVTIAQPGTDAHVAGNAMLNTSPPPTQVEIGTCIGSQCSQWRWDGDSRRRIVAPAQSADAAWLRGADGELERAEPLPRPPPVDGSWTWHGRLGLWSKLYDAGDRPGHCGLAGSAPYD